MNIIKDEVIRILENYHYTKKWSYWRMANYFGLSTTTLKRVLSYNSMSLDTAMIILNKVGKTLVVANKEDNK